MVFFLFKIIVIGLGFLLISPLIALMFVFKIIALIAKGIEAYSKRKIAEADAHANKTKTLH